MSKQIFHQERDKLRLHWEWLEHQKTIEECEQEQKEIESKIRAKKTPK